MQFLREIMYIKYNFCDYRYYVLLLLITIRFKYPINDTYSVGTNYLKSSANLILYNPSRLQYRSSNIVALDDALARTNMHMYIAAYNTIQHMSRVHEREKQTN